MSSTFSGKEKSIVPESAIECQHQIIIFVNMPSMQALAEFRKTLYQLYKMSITQSEVFIPTPGSHASAAFPHL